MKNLIQFGSLIIFSSIFIYGCNNAGSSTTATQSSSSITRSSSKPVVLFDHATASQTEPEQTLDTLWTIDGENTSVARSTLKDLGWHLITVTVIKTDALTTPVAVKGLRGIISPKPPIDLGQKIDIKDINCESAIFGKVGDSCSAYFRFDYNHLNNQVGDEGIQFPAEIGANSYPKIPGTVTLDRNINPNSLVADVRTISPVESAYYSGLNVATNSNLYHIAFIQNGLYNPINITSFATSDNPVFTLINRTTGDDNDPVYGSYAQCTASSNPLLKQVNSLINLNDSCLLIYKAAENGNNLVEELQITANTNAHYSFPRQTATLKQSYTPICNNANEPTIATADNLCNNYAAANRLNVDAGTVSFGNISLSDDSKTCNMNAQANFYTIAYNCNGVNVSTYDISTNKCNGVSPTWGPVQLSGSSCIRTSLPFPCISTGTKANSTNVQQGSRICGNTSWKSTFIAK